MIFNIRNLLTSLAILLLAACGGGGGGGTGPTAVLTPGVPGSVTLSWIAPSMNSDGSTLIDLSGFRIYESTSSDESTLMPIATLTNPGLATYVVDNLPSGRHYFAITALNSLDIESDLSIVASVDVE